MPPNTVSTLTIQFRGQTISITLLSTPAIAYINFWYADKKWCIDLRKNEKIREYENQRGLYQIEKNKQAPANFDEILCKDIIARFDALINEFGTDKLKSNLYANLTPTKRWTPYRFLLDELIFDFLSENGRLFK